MNLETQFAKLERRAAKARHTIAEVLQEAAVPRLSYWRAKEGKYAKQDTSIAVLRACEGALDRIEENQRKAKS